MHRPARQSVVGVLMSAAMSMLGACSDSTGPSAASAAAIAAVSGTGQSGTVGTTLSSPVVFEVTTAGDAPVSGVTVSFAVTSGTATVTPQTATIQWSTLPSTMQLTLIRTR